MTDKIKLSIVAGLVAIVMTGLVFSLAYLNLTATKPDVKPINSISQPEETSRTSIKKQKIDVKTCQFLNILEQYKQSKDKQGFLIDKKDMFREQISMAKETNNLDNYRLYTLFYEYAKQVEEAKSNNLNLFNVLEDQNLPEIETTIQYLDTSIC